MNSATDASLMLSAAGTLATASALTEVGGSTLTLAGGDGSGLVVTGPGGAVVTNVAAIHTVSFPAPRASFSIEQSGTGLVVHDSAGHTDLLTGIDRIVFQDGALAYDTGAGQNGGEAYRLYQAAFGRTPDSAGLGYWLHQLDGGMSLHDIAAAFVGSQEFTALTGGAQSSADTFLTTLYDNVLHRAPDAAGYVFWSGALAHGVVRADVLANFSESAENQAQLVGTIGHGFSYTPYI